MLLARVLSCLLLANTIWAQDKLVIISPHRKSIQNEFIFEFKKYYKESFSKEIVVDWIDQGGSENDLRFVIGRFKNSPASTGIDVFWGGGDLTFRDLDHRKLLLSYKLPEKIQKSFPKSLLGLSLQSTNNTWYSTALSTFGIFYNKSMLQILKKPEPKSWEDLAKPEYQGYVSLADPRHSSSSLVMSIIILEVFGWEKGWQILTAIAANTDKFTHSSSDPIKAVVSGQVLAATAVDFYAQAKIVHLGEKALGFSYVPGKTIFNSDPVGILKGAKNLVPAQRFVNFLLSPRAQKLFVLPKGISGGPRFANLGRISVLPQVYQDKRIFKSAINPFVLKNTGIKIDFEKFFKIKTIIGDLIGVYHIAYHSDLKEFWKKSGQGLRLSASKLPISKEDIMNLAKRWHETDFRHNMISTWSKKAKKLYTIHKKS
jgi:iron(III) transport system substrate-binding protein